MACHKGLELASNNHRVCVDCHGGDPQQADKDAAHRAMYGPKNPADPKFWDKTCGRCHPYHLQRVRANLMYTNSGMIKNIQKTWEGYDGRSYSTHPEYVFSATGQAKKLNSVARLENLAGELFRKFCSQCHLGREANQKYSASHSSGCAACHFPYNDIATYEGGDPTIKGQGPHSADHQLAALPGNDVCFRCHNRSGRIALSYQGLSDGNNALVPTRDGLPGPQMISGGRNVARIRADVHFAGGMDCIDCHTSRDVMGDGYAYENMYDQTEIGCEDCHGSGLEAPAAEEITRENDEVVRESKSYQRRMRPGMKMAKTRKGRKYANVFFESDTVYVLGKRSGKLFKSPVITGTPEHTISGHQRLECYTCHSRAVPQCYGCHTTYDQTRFGKDYIKVRMTAGKFSETEDYRSLYPFPLAVNQRDKISPVTPGCQTFVTVIDAQGRLVKKDYVSAFNGKNQLRFAPFYSHNTGTKAVGCSECHGNPAFLGFGQHVVEGGNIRATLVCEKSEHKPLDGFLNLQAGKITAVAAITREHSRPLGAAEIKKILAVNQCLVCHDDPKDSIYQKPLDFSMLKTCFNRSGVRDMGPATPVAEKAVQPPAPGKPPVSDRTERPLNCEGLFEQAMSTRIMEKAFVDAAFGKAAPQFFQKNCQGCHVESCEDCHGKETNGYSPPQSDPCLDCHKGYFVGMEYYGMAPREDHLRYQRGKVFKGETFLTMSPDVHARAGMQCADCHSMQSLIEGKKASKTCTDCHQPDPAVIEHGIDAHLEKLECYACHSAWAAQEYGTFYVRMVDSSGKDYFRLRSLATDRYIKSAYLKKQDNPPLGINSKGKISPIRPQFITYFTDVKNDRPVDEENRLLTAQWKAFFPHTVRRGTVMCDGCHGNPGRFVLEKEEDRMYQLQQEGMKLISFWDQSGQTVINGSFMPPERFAGMAARKPAYKKAYVKKWKKLLEAVENSSKP
ncbi:MAG: hypothetical protein KKH68_13870 [Proteobacteria bacterium]|nr:hypothetical protein [Pseudomonadota bacterium]